MFRRNRVNKAKLEHKLYLARENPEPVFDLTDCGLNDIPSGIYSLCRVFLKESLRLDHNYLGSLSGGGQLKDLHLLKVLNLNHNSFHSLPDDIYLLKNLQELYVNDNQLKKLPGNICNLKRLKILDVSGNSLKMLPENIGGLTNLKKLNISGNKHLKTLPKSLSQCQRLNVITLDPEGFIYPPSDVVDKGLESIMEFICNDVGIPYTPLDSEETQIDGNPEIPDSSDVFQERIWELERIKQQKVQEFLEIERNNELLQKQELELANASKLNREKLLAVLTEQQNLFDSELNRIQQVKEYERFRLIEQLQEAENNADIVIKQLLAFNCEPLVQLLEQERQEEERLLAAVSRYEALRKDDILAAMQDILEQETEKFRQFHESRVESSRSILEQEMEMDSRLLEVLQNQDEHKADLVSKLLEDSDLQKAAVGTLLERGDARSWGLLQQVNLVESQLAALTNIEIDRKKLQMDEHMNDLSEKRINLSVLLIDLLDQQRERRAQLLSTLQTMEETNNSVDDFWLRQYQRLLDKLPEGLSQAQKNIDPALAQALLVNGVIHCLPFLAKLLQSQCDTHSISDEELRDAGVMNSYDRAHILDAFQMYEKEKLFVCENPIASAPQIPLEGASAPLPEQLKTINYSECVICLDLECQIIFLPCGHLCCCLQCSTSVAECPLCRTDIERKITMHRA